MSIVAASFPCIFKDSAAGSMFFLLNSSGLVRDAHVNEATLVAAILKANFINYNRKAVAVVT